MIRSEGVFVKIGFKSSWGTRMEQKLKTKIGPRQGSSFGFWFSNSRKPNPNSPYGHPYALVIGSKLFFFKFKEKCMKDKNLAPNISFLLPKKFGCDLGIF